ncbi:hypothetical protein EON63_10920 [archaeon]|nr:MAG: hypothetical protein EON63_10920 [archaeon]
MVIPSDTHSLSHHHTSPYTIQVSYDGHKLAEDVAIIPVLRAGLSMCDGMLDLMPRAAVHHIGMCTHSLCTIHHIPYTIYHTPYTIYHTP